MEYNRIPLIEDLTLSRIGDLLCNRYNYAREQLGTFIDRDIKTYHRKVNGQSKVFEKDVDSLIENITKRVCKGDTHKFYEIIKDWFPLLRIYETDEEVRKVFTVNLMGLASNQDTLASSDNDYISTVQFFRSCLDYGFPIKSIKLAAQTGWSFFDDAEKRNLLKELLKQKIHIQFIGNPMSAEMRYIVKAMCDPEKELDYRGVNATLTQWHKYETAYDNMELRVSVNYPILHQSYIVEFADGSERLLMRDYAYGSPVDVRAPRKLITNQSPDYEYYKTEYEFIWKNGITYDEWKKSTPKVEESLPTSSYILIPDEVDDEVQGEPIPLTTIELFEEALSGTTELGKIATVDMCFHGGAFWHIEGSRNKLLTKALNEGIKIRVIVNTTAQVNEICAHMKQPNLQYMDFEKNIQNWFELMLKHPDSMEIHIANVPLFRRTYIIRGEKSKGWANITYYSYGNVIEDCQRVNYRSGSCEYKLYVDEFEYIWNNASEVYSEAFLMVSKPKRNDGFNESDENNIAFVRKALENQSCRSLDIISVLAYYCAIGRLRELIKTRLSDDSNFILRMILPNPINGENLEKWFIGFEQESMVIFKTFESWTKRYPGRFLLHYTNLPIADRIYINKFEKRMLVEHLSIPRSTNQALQEEYSKTTTPQIYDAFEDQFERIWTEFSDSFK